MIDHPIAPKSPGRDLEVLEVLEVGRVDSSTNLSRLRCRAVVDQKESSWGVAGQTVETSIFGKGGTQRQLENRRAAFQRMRNFELFFFFFLV